MLAREGRTPPERFPTSPSRLLVKAYGSFHPRSVPAYSRANYRRELTASFFFPIALAAVEGAVIAVLVMNAYAGLVDKRMLAYAVGLLGSAGELANITSFLWAAVAHGRDKVKLIAGLQGVVVLMVGVVALSPRTAAGLWVLAAAVLAARVAMAGVFTLRATVWRANYPRKERARVTGKFSTMQVVVIACVGLIVALGQDVSREWFKGLLLLSCALGAVGVAAYSRIRVRGHRHLRKAEMGGAAHERPSLNPMSMWRVLASDRHYAGFQASLFVIGTGNLMLTAPLAITLADRFGMSSFSSMVVMSSLPYLVIPWAIPFWTQLLAKRHVVRFRVLHSWVFVVSQSLVLVAAVTRTLELMYIAALFQGVAMAGGSLAWNLGHLDFAPPHRASSYMGVHVTLNGVRGLLAPLLAVSIFNALHEWRDGAEQWVFAFSVALCVAGAIGFKLVATAMGERAEVSREG